MGIPETGCLARRMLLNVTGRHLVFPFSTQISFPTTHHHVEQGRLCDGQAMEGEGRRVVDRGRIGGSNNSVSSIVTLGTQSERERAFLLLWVVVEDNPLSTFLTEYYCPPYSTLKGRWPSDRKESLCHLAVTAPSLIHLLLWGLSSDEGRTLALQQFTGGHPATTTASGPEQGSSCCDDYQTTVAQRRRRWNGGRWQ